MTPRKPSPSRYGIWRVATVIVVLSAAAVACGSSKSATSGSATSVPATTAPSTTGPSTSTSAAALSAALTASFQAETSTLATYRNVVSTLGSVGPFPNVISAEQQHVSTVTALFNRYGVAVPAAGAGQASPATLSAACTLGVTLEQQIITLYADQLPKVSAYADVTTAFQNLQAAAKDNHLPAFQRC